MEKNDTNEHVKEPCISPSHNAPLNIYVPHGQEYEYICPCCGEKTVIKGNSVY